MFTTKELDYVKKVLGLSGDLYLSKVSPRAYSMESTMDSIDLGAFTIRKYRGIKEERRIGAAILSPVDLYEVTVVVTTGGSYWEQPDTDYKVVEDGIASLFDAVMLVICESLKDRIASSIHSDELAEAFGPEL